jgi:hypothetical protein
MTICTCEYSPVNSTTIDPPHIVFVDPFCCVHGLATISDDEYERDAEDAQRKRDAREGFDD